MTAKLDALAAIGRLSTRPTYHYQTIKVETITPVLGAEVSGIDLANPLTDREIGEIRTAFLEHHVLVFRDQLITAEDQKRLAAHFGPLRPVLPRPPGADPYVLEVRTGAEAPAVYGNGWHVDGSADPAPSLGSMLYVTEVPAGGAGGDTMFANMHLAYEMCSAPLRTMLDGLTAVHDGAYAYRGAPLPAGYEPQRSEHPVVVRHPETGRKALFVNQAYTSHIPQLLPAESKALLDLLFALVPNQPALSCRIRWQPHTLVFWDNRCVQHHAVYDYYPLTRHGRRVAIDGTAPRV